MTPPTLHGYMQVCRLKEICPFLSVSSKEISKIFYLLTLRISVVKTPSKFARISSSEHSKVCKILPVDVQK